MTLTKNFSLSEFACNDGTPVPKKYISNCQELANNLQIIRDEINEPIEILSGYRTDEWNEKVGGAKKSQHKLAKAGDLIARSKSPHELYTAILSLIERKKIKNGGVGLYKSFVHYDIGPARRWVG